MKLERTIPKILRAVAARYPEVPAQLSHSKDGSYKPTNYHDFYQTALDFGGALLEMGVRRGDKIGLIADNRAEWEHADMGLLAIGAVDVPRGCDATEKDLAGSMTNTAFYLRLSAANLAEAKKREGSKK